MYPELLTYAPTVRAEFHLSLPQDLITSLRLLQAVDAFEGLSEWVYQTAASLPNDYRSEVNTLSYPIKWCFRRQDGLILRLPPDHPAHSDWEAFRAYLEMTSDAEYRRVLLLNLAQEVDESQPPVVSDESVLRQMLTKVRHLERHKWGRTFVDPVDDESLIALIETPTQLKERLVGLLTHFWEAYYRQDFEANREAMVRSVAYHRCQVYPKSFTDLFRQVTGRALSVVARDYVQQHLEKIERVIFNPCAHLGLFFQINLSFPTLVVAFNYRTTPALERDSKVTVELFPPLKAFADETRLHILSLLQEHEMYAQEIVGAVGLSQSTVSRHLQLLERTEVVTARQTRGMKFYSINRVKGRAILEALLQLIG